MLPISIDVKSRTPIFEQLVNNVKSLIFSGMLKPDEPLPSVRSLACELAINPNTIQKAYAELERQGVTYAVSGRGSFVSSNTEALSKAHSDAILAEFCECTRRAREASMDIELVINTIRSNWRASND